MPPQELELFFLNVVLNIAIWCTIFHHVKQQHVYWGVLTLEQDGQKSGGVMPPSLKSEGATDMNFLHLFVALLQEVHFPEGIKQKSFQCEIKAIFT